MKESKEVQCLICNKIIKNVKGLSQHLKFKHNILYRNYCLNFNLPLKEYTPLEKNYNCKICNKLSNKERGIQKHLRFKHNITIKKYYDLFYKKENEGICLLCNKPTRFISFREGYKLHCSIKCSNKNTIYAIKRTEKRLETEKNNPEIRIKATKKRLETEKNNPNIMIKRIKSYKRTISENPEIRIRTTKNYKKTLSENPEIIINANKKRKITHEKNPVIRIEANKKHAIYLRNKYSELQKSNSTLPYFLYIIQHIEKPIIKIGRTANTEKRLKEIINDFGEYILIYKLKGPYNKIQPLENFLHNYFKDYCEVQLSGGGRTEWFCSSIINNILNIIDKNYFHLSGESPLP